MPYFNKLKINQKPNKMKHATKRIKEMLASALLVVKHVDGSSHNVADNRDRDQNTMERRESEM